MNQRQKIVAAIFLSIVISLSVGFVTEYVRDSWTFSWAITEGDAYFFDIVVTGNTTTGSTTLPPLFVEMNNTRISVEMISLPNVSIIFYSDGFIERVVEHMKTTSQFANGSAIPTEFRSTINIHSSYCILPIGAWHHLDSFFPSAVNRSVIGHESYLASHRGSSFYFGYSTTTETNTHEWHTFIDLQTGVPTIMTFFIYRLGQPWSYSYNVTMSLVA
jgi:hypothetical protein